MQTQRAKIDSHDRPNLTTSGISRTVILRTMTFVNLPHPRNTGIKINSNYASRSKSKQFSCEIHCFFFHFPYRSYRVVPKCVFIFLTMNLHIKMRKRYRINPCPVYITQFPFIVVNIEFCTYSKTAKCFSNSLKSIFCYFFRAHYSPQYAIDFQLTKNRMDLTDSDF